MSLTMMLAGGSKLKNTRRLDVTSAGSSERL
jgi:hypothetical protein